MARCGTSPRCQASGETEETSDAKNAPPKEIFVAFAQHLLFFKAMPWEDAESLHKQLHAAFGCGRPPALRKFVDEISDFLRPTGLKVRKVFCDGSRSSTAFLILHSEAEEELPVSLSALRTLQRVSKKFSLTQLHIFQAAASYLLRTRQPLTLLQWIRLCQAKGGCAPSLLQSLLELQFLRVENAEGDPTQLRLVLGPWCYAVRTSRRKDGRQRSKQRKERSAQTHTNREERHAREESATRKRSRQEEKKRTCWTVT
ncbi:hypothetical protein TGPRC2_219530 [Toxoplasma gondii TgCatPRC2]|uniref:Uncharacterized protein n=1 Tax=Toxoplasma gondii TgCatPRC2 TaxID=1130821 RepID=A0A151HCX6_TOXGO|nr:hypothetical protein TGPRC2_219530 [Toxoplasma gondii TgCatPRC2]